MIPDISDSTITLTPVTPSNLDRFAQRTVTAVEGHCYGAAYEAIQARSAVEQAFQWDTQHDRYLAAAVDAIDDGLKRLALDRESRLFLRGVRKLIGLAQEADALEDGHITTADGRMAAAHEESKAGAGMIEMLLVGRERD